MVERSRAHCKMTSVGVVVVVVGGLLLPSVPRLHRRPQRQQAREGDRGMRVAVGEGEGGGVDHWADRRRVQEQAALRDALPSQ